MNDFDEKKDPSHTHIGRRIATNKRKNTEKSNVGTTSYVM